MKKKIISLVLCSTLAFASIITANAAEKNTDSVRFVDLKTEQYVPANTILLYSYNMDPEHTGRLIYRKFASPLAIDLNFKNCSQSPETMEFTSADEYSVGIDAQKEPFGYGRIGYSKYTGGLYKKVRIKLSDFSEHFTEDGKYIYNNETFDFNKKTNADGTFYYDTFLVFKSGAAHTAVMPDENGEVEIYVSVNPLHKPQTLLAITDVLNVLGPSKIDVQFGDVNNSTYVDVDDVTTMQFAIAGLTALDDYGNFNADINADGVFDVQDVTDLQLALAKKA